MYVHTKMLIRTDNKCLVECVAEGEVLPLGIEKLLLSFQSAEAPTGQEIPVVLFERSFRNRRGLSPGERGQIDAALKQRFHEVMDARRHPAFRVNLERDNGETVQIELVAHVTPGHHGIFDHKTGYGEPPTGTEIIPMHARTIDGHEFDTEALSEAEFDRLTQAVEEDYRGRRYEANADAPEE